MAIKRRKGDARAGAPKEERWGFDSGVRKSIEIPLSKDRSKNPFRRKTDTDKQPAKPKPAETDD